MSLSISSSKRALIIVAAVFLAGEGAIRMRETALSVDLQHIRRIPAIVTQLEHEDSPRVLFLGNSLTRYGVETATVREVLAAGGAAEAGVEAVHPDDTGLSDWHYLYERYVEPEPSHPDVLIVGYALAEMNDLNTLHPDRLGRYFGGPAATAEAFRYDIPSFEDRVTYLLSCYSSLFANRERIRERILSAVVPDYAEVDNLINDDLQDSGEKAGRPAAPTFAKLHRFLKMTRHSGTRTVIVAMPQPGPYYVAPGMIEAIRSEGAEFVDLRQVEGITPADFFDGFHMAPSGAHIYSQRLAEILLERRIVAPPLSATR